MHQENMTTLSREKPSTVRTSPDYITRLEIVKQRLAAADAQKLKADNDLQQLRSELYDILQAIPDALLIFRISDSVCTYVNPAFRRIYGYDETDVLNSSVSLGLFFEDPEDLKRVRINLDSLGRVDDFEFKCRDKEQLVRDAVLSASTIHFQGEQSILAFIKDVTLPKRNQQEVQRLETILNQAREIETLGQLAGSIAHEFNNLLMAINGNASLMLYKLDEQHPHFIKLKQIMQSVQSGTELTRQLFDFSRQGKLRMNVAEFNERIQNRKQTYMISPPSHVADSVTPSPSMSGEQNSANGSSVRYPQPPRTFTQNVAFTAYEEIQKVPSTILLVDDEHMLIDVGKEMLEKIGASVITAMDGPGALRVYDKYGEKVDLVILDLVMPGMDGEAVFRALREKNPQVRVLISSGYSHQDNIRRLLDSGCDGFIQKPFNVVTLARTIKSILKP